MPGLETIPDGPLSADERKALRAMIRDQERAAWFWATIRVYVGWGAAVITSLYAAKDQIVKVFKAIMS